MLDTICQIGHVNVLNTQCKNINIPHHKLTVWLLNLQIKHTKKRQT